ncbi:hypothetical protein SAMN04488057_11642 [Cyclobacterium lianum]|uniref:Uncharacterized protein n=1 Tax=Cyclobacterium lianum TaxID=388280 RepID=A0A1M7QC46_9BACT|nr:hypothetical protein [Cyclobacterium lianum]SHN28271.1 hypothetical protein SAMN04488057_11642 [Cyclobacterium lianum]
MDKGAKLFLLICFYIISSRLCGQEIVVESYFLQDSAMLGERVGYVLKARYPSDLPLLFPDSTYNFGEFELLEKQSFESYTADSISLDSAVYWLSNFSLDSVKSFQMPVFEILKYDSISHFSEPAALALKLTIAEMPEELAFQQNDNYLNIPTAFNYPYLILGLVALVVVIVLAIYFFGGKLRKRWQIYREKKKWKHFLNNWEQSMQTLVEKPEIQEADELLGLWKGYLENLTGLPYKEWTSTEIADYLQNPDIVKDFRKIELIIYANRIDDHIREACNSLLDVSRQQLEGKIENIRQHE